jgi:hypothetical protein
MRGGDAMIGRCLLDWYCSTAAARKYGKWAQKYGQWRLPYPVCVLIGLVSAPVIFAVAMLVGVGLAWAAERLGVPRKLVMMVIVPAVFFAVYMLAKLVLFALKRPGIVPEGIHCTTCGYNLTGNVSGRCPECGEAAGMGNS